MLTPIRKPTLARGRYAYHFNDLRILAPIIYIISVSFNSFNIKSFCLSDHVVSATMPYSGEKDNWIGHNQRIFEL